MLSLAHYRLTKQPVNFHISGAISSCTFLIMNCSFVMTGFRLSSYVIPLVKATITKVLLFSIFDR